MVKYLMRYQSTMGNKLDIIINENYENLNNIDRHILGWIQSHLNKCVKLSVSELSNECNVSTATVLRTCQKLGFSGYSEFKFQLKKDLEAEKLNQLDTSNIIEDDINQTVKFFKNNTDIQNICHLINNSKNIYAYGTGQGQRLMLQEFARCFLNVNKNIIVVPSTTELKIINKFINNEDLLFVASWSGKIDKYKEPILSISLKDVPIVSITNLTTNALSSLAKYNLYFQSTHVDKDMNINLSSYLTLHLVLHLLYDSYIDYLNNEKSPTSSK